MWLEIIIIVFVISLALGPVMIMRPSAGQKKIANLRVEAARLGFRVSLNKLTGYENSGPLARYELSWPEPVRKMIKQKSLGEWLLVRKGYAHEMHVMEHWEWRKKPDEQWENILRTTFENHKNTLGEHILALEGTEMGFSVYWLEKKEAGDASTVFRLQALKQQLSAMLVDIESAVKV